MTPPAPDKIIYHCISFADRTEGAAFVAALSRFLSSPKGASYLEQANVVEVRSRTRADAQLELYLSTSAFAAAVEAFSPVPSSQIVSPDTLPEDCVAVISRSVSAWGLEEAQNHI
jgi:hypothetical protein